MFLFIDTDLKIDKPQTVVEIDRDKAALLGLTDERRRRRAGPMLGGGYVNYFGLAGAVLQGDSAGAATLAAESPTS